MTCQMCRSFSPENSVTFFLLAILTTFSTCSTIQEVISNPVTSRVNGKSIMSLLGSRFPRSESASLSRPGFRYGEPAESLRRPRHVDIDADGVVSRARDEDGVAGGGGGGGDVSAEGGIRDVDNSLGPYPDRGYYFAHEVYDKPTLNYQAREESRRNGRTEGFYSWLRPDGRMQVVRYFASRDTGFLAEVNSESHEVFDSEEATTRNIHDLTEEEEEEAEEPEIPNPEGVDTSPENAPEEITPEVDTEIPPIAEEEVGVEPQTTTEPETQENQQQQLQFLLGSVLLPPKEEPVDVEPPSETPSDRQKREPVSFVFRHKVRPVGYLKRFGSMS